jgi:branched-chain amino acid transport system permease protein
VAAVAVALLQQFANYYLGVGDFAVVVLLAVVLLTRPSGLLGRKVA